MSRNIVPRTNRDSSLGTPFKNWDKVYADSVIIGGEPIKQKLTNDITLTIGSSGEFPSINSALSYATSKYYPVLLNTGNVPRITIRLLPGFVMEEQVIVESLNLSWITIIGDDAETSININTIYNHVFKASNGGFLPIIGQLFNMNAPSNLGQKSGIVVEHNSQAIILPNCGVKNAANHGLFANCSSKVNASETNFSGARGNGIYARYSSIINANKANASGAKWHGFNASYGGIINANNSIAENVGSAHYGYNVLSGCIINAYESTGTFSQTKNQVTVQGIIFDY